MAETQERARPKGVTIYSVVSSQAGGVSDAILRGMAGAKIEEFKAVIPDHLAYWADLCDESVKITLEKVWQKTRDKLIDDGKYLIDAWKAGLGLQIGTAFMGLIEGYTGYPQMLGAYLTSRFDASIRPRLERYFLSKYTPALPNLAVGFKMMMEGRLSRGEFNQLALEEGWETKWHDKLYDYFDRDPNEFMAFTMWKRGLISEATMKQCWRIRGYDVKWDTALKGFLHRRPSFRELMTLSDYVPLPDLWVREVLRADGRTEGDINYIAPAIMMRPLREEVRSVVGRYLWQRQIGRLDEDTLEKNLEALGLQPKEVELNMLWGELRYQDELLDEKLDIIEAKVQYGDPDYQTQDAIKTAITALGVLEEKANLMAELWYYKYIYSPP